MCSFEVFYADIAQKINKWEGGLNSIFYIITLTFLINGEVLIIGEGGKFPKWGG